MPIYLRGRVYWAYYYDPTGEKIRFSCKTRDRKVAERVLRERERAAHDPSRPAQDAAPQVELIQAIERAISAPRRQPRSQATLDYYRAKAGHLIRLLPEQLDELTYSCVEDYIAQRRTEGAADGTVYKELTVLRLTLKHARKRGELSKSWEELLPDFGEGYQPKSTYLTKPQAARLLDRLAPFRAAPIAFMIATGARHAETFRAQPEDLPGDGTALIRGSKTRSAWRVVPIAYPDWLRVNPPFEPWLNIRRDLHVVCDALKIPRVSPNDLRRSTATWLLEDGVPLDLVAKILGHTTTAITGRTYARPDPASLRRMLDTIQTHRAPAKEENPTNSPASEADNEAS